MDYERIRTNFIEERLETGFLDENMMNEAYEFIYNNTKRVSYPKQVAIIDTSNYVNERNLSLADFFGEEEKEAYAKMSTSPNEERPDTTFIMGEYKPAEGTQKDVVDFVNSTICLSAVVPNSIEEAYERFSEINFLTVDDARKILEDVGFSHIPLGRNAAEGILSGAVGTGRSLSSIFDIPNGKLKREFSVISTALCGGNIDSNTTGELKVTFNKGSGYVSNFKELKATKAIEILKEHFNKLGYDDVKFEEGLLETYFLTSLYSSKKLGEEVLANTSIPGTNGIAKILFKTSDFGLSSLNVTPVLEFNISSGKMGADRIVKISLSETINLNHNASLNEEEGETMVDLWKKKVEELFAIVKENSDKVKASDLIEMKFPTHALNNVLEHIGATSSFTAKDEILEEFFDSFSVDCTARDVFIYAFAIIGEWEKSNLLGAARAKEKLMRILISNNWSKFDVIKAA